ncbi:hypothetical protein H4R33_005659 [Dimargaris cristalligena]|nr:hypothetical protein H4R33_005659 [Dimargaris cristalligena]
MKFTNTVFTLATISVYAQAIASSIPTTAIVSPIGPFTRRSTLSYDTNHQLVRRAQQGGATTAKNPGGKSFQQSSKANQDAFKVSLGSKLLAGQKSRQNQASAAKPAVTEKKTPAPSKIPVPVKKSAAPSTTPPPPSAKQPVNRSTAAGMGSKPTEPKPKPNTGTKPLFVNARYPGTANKV